MGTFGEYCRGGNFFTHSGVPNLSTTSADGLRSDRLAIGNGLVEAAHLLLARVVGARVAVVAVDTAKDATACLANLRQTLVRLNGAIAIGHALDLVTATAAAPLTIGVGLVVADAGRQLAEEDLAAQATVIPFVPAEYGLVLALSCDARIGRAEVAVVTVARLHHVSSTVDFRRAVGRVDVLAHLTGVGRGGHIADTQAGRTFRRSRATKNHSRDERSGQFQHDILPSFPTHSNHPGPKCIGELFFETAHCFTYL